MVDVLVLDADQVRMLVDAQRLFEPIEHALLAHSTGRSSIPPRIAAASPQGLLAAMPGYIEGVGMGSKLVSVFAGNEVHGLPAHQAVIVLFDERTGAPIALMDGTHITAVRTAAAAAVAARLLARSDARVLAILGAGVQGRSHLDAFPKALALDEIVIASRDLSRAEALAERSSVARAAASFEDAVRVADVVACCTDARAPILRRDWLTVGAHVSSVGFGVEIDDETVRAAGVFVEWRGAASLPPPAGAGDLQGLDPGAVTEVGEILAGTRPGRASYDQITLYKSTGHALEDLAAARVVHDEAVRRGLGTTIRL